MRSRDRRGQRAGRRHRLLACTLLRLIIAPRALLPAGLRQYRLVPDGGSSLFLPTRVGMARATELSMLAERLPAAKALEWGLINRVVADAELEKEAARSPSAWQMDDALLRRRQAPAQQLAVRRMPEQLESRPDSRRDGASDDFSRRDRLRGEASRTLLRSLGNPRDKRH